MQDRIFGDREKAMEETYFRNEDARLLDKLRQKAHLDDIGQALAEALQVNNPDLLLRAQSLGITLDTAAALFLAPLVQVAWAGGSVTRAEHDAVLRLARGRGVETDSPSYVQINEWLEDRSTRQPVRNRCRNHQVRPLRAAARREGAAHRDDRRIMS